MPLFSKPLRQGQLQVGDHIWYYTHGGLIQHHGIWDGKRVIHFDDADTDNRYGKCKECRALLRDRPRGYVRSSCLTCFRLGDPNRNYYRCEYGKGIASLMFREKGSRSMEVSHAGELVAARAWWFFENDNVENIKFGKWELFSHNCEDFARFCKTLKLGSKQAISGLFVAGVGDFGKFVVVAAAILAQRKYVQARLRRRMRANLR